LRDTINVSYWDGVSKAYPSVKLRMDFRDPNVVGTFVYHCHLLEHEDGGMMGLIRVDAATRTANSQPRLSAANRRLCGNPAALASIRSRSQHAVTFSPTNINENDSRAIARAKTPAQNSF